MLAIIHLFQFCGQLLQKHQLAYRSQKCPQNILLQIPVFSILTKAKTQVQYFKKIQNLSQKKLSFEDPSTSIILQNQTNSVKITFHFKRPP